MPKETVHELGDAQLSEDLAHAKSELRSLRFKLATGSLEDTTQLKLWKKKVARINTELREREIAAAEAQGSSS